MGLALYEEAVNLLYNADDETPAADIAAARDVVLEKTAQTRTVEQLRRLLGDARTWTGIETKDETTRLVEACLLGEDQIQ